MHTYQHRSTILITALRRRCRDTCSPGHGSGDLPTSPSPVPGIAEGCSSESSKLAAAGLAFQAMLQAASRRRQTPSTPPDFAPAARRRLAASPRGAAVEAVRGGSSAPQACAPDFDVPVWSAKHAARVLCQRARGQPARPESLRGAAMESEGPSRRGAHWAGGISHEASCSVAVAVIASRSSRSRRFAQATLLHARPA